MSGGKSYRGTAVDVTFDARRCLHAAECVRGLPAVFDSSRRPWVVPDAADAAAVAEVVRRCPSGALHAHLADGSQETPDRPTTVRLHPDGRLELRGELLLLVDGVEQRETRATLCGCGRSRALPWCDNAHREDLGGGSGHTRPNRDV